MMQTLLNCTSLRIFTVKSPCSINMVKTTDLKLVWYINGESNEQKKSFFLFL